MIKLYHGSNLRIARIDLSFSKNGKDFGKGFYLNKNRQQAMDMAVRTAKRQMSGKPIVNTYLFDDTVGVQIRRFILGYISIDTLIDELKFNGSHAIQYFFGTEEAVKLLTATDDE